jgi:carbamoylphosphate synthase small subunit
MITAQNHGFAVDDSNLPANLRVTHTSLFDHTVQGIHRTDKRRSASRVTRSQPGAARCRTVVRSLYRTD